jgi:hypothetical protein
VPSQTPLLKTAVFVENLEQRKLPKSVSNYEIIKLIHRGSFMVASRQFSKSLLLYWLLTYNFLLGVLVLLVTSVNQASTWEMYDVVSFVPIDAVAVITKFELTGFNNNSLGSHALVGFAVLTTSWVTRRIIFRKSPPETKQFPFGIESRAKLGIFTFLVVVVVDELLKNSTKFGKPNQSVISSEFGTYTYFAVRDDLTFGVPMTVVVASFLLVAVVFRWTNIFGGNSVKMLRYGRSYKRLKLVQSRDFTIADTKSLTKSRYNTIWLTANLVRPESLVILVGLPLFSVGIADGMPWYNFLLGYLAASAFFAVLRLLSNVLLLGTIVLLMCIPIVGWLVLIGMVLLRVDWFMKNAFSCWAITFMLGATIGSAFLPGGHILRISVTFIVVFACLTVVYLSGRSTLEFFDVVMSFPAALVLLGIAVANIFINLATDDGTDSHSESVTKMKLAKSNYDDSPKIEVVKAHLRTAPDGIEQNNLSYEGPGKIAPNGKFVSVESYVRGDSWAGSAHSITVNEVFAGESVAMTSTQSGATSADLSAALRLEIARRNGVLPCVLMHGHESAIAVLSGQSHFRDVRYALHLGLSLFVEEWKKFFRGMSFKQDAQIENFKNFWIRIVDDDQIQETVTSRVSTVLWTCTCLSSVKA